MQGQSHFRTTCYLSKPYNKILKLLILFYRDKLVKKKDKEKNHIMIPNDLWYENSCQWFLSYIRLWIFLLKKHLNFLLSMVSCCLLHRGNNWDCFKLHLRVYLRDPFPSICSRGNTKVQQESLPWDCLQQRFQSNITRSCMYRAT